MHWLLYALVIAQPLSGLLLIQVEGHTLALFGSIPLPQVMAENEGLEEMLEGIHGSVWILLAVAAALHTAAALKHHFIDRDRTLMRMLRG